MYFTKTLNFGPASSSGTVVEQQPRQPKVGGSNPTTAAGTGKEKWKCQPLNGYTYRHPDDIHLIKLNCLLCLGSGKLDEHRGHQNL